MTDTTERLMWLIGIPEAFMQKTGDRAPEGMDELIQQLTEAAESREGGPWKRIPETIWLATMKCFPRFIAEYRRSYGKDGFDRYGWTVRQTECRLFRIGELEYELLDEDGKRSVGLHIPSDAKLEADRLNESVRRAWNFLGEYFPEWQGTPMKCESWLLSPKLKELLPPKTRIRRFQDAFDLIRENPDDMAALEWVFYIAEGQRAGVQTEKLPENTSLQKKMKAMLLKGEKPGSARGILKREFRGSEEEQA